MNDMNIQRMNRKLKHITLFALLLLAGSVVVAQNDPQYVIKKGDHYLARVKSGTTWAVTNTDSFNPNTCLWYSGPNIEHNYYFIDSVENVPVYHYLAAELDADAPLTLSSSHPGTVVLNKSTEPYYFWDWDHGVSRGVQLGDGSYENCQSEYNGLNPEGNQCWKVVWVSYENNGWKMSHDYGYGITTNAAFFHYVAVTKHDAVVTNETGGAPTIADFAMTYSASPVASHPLNGVASPYSYTITPAYIHYHQEAYIDPDTHATITPEVNYYAYNNSYTNTTTPGSTNVTGATANAYSWTISGDGAQYLSFSTTPNVLTSISSTPTLYYVTQNTETSHKVATLTLSVTYGSGTSQVTQKRTIKVTVKTECQNPVQAAAPEVTYDNVIVSWVSTADKYKLEWKESGQDWTAAQSIEDITATSHTFTNLAYGKTYDYRVSAFCGSSYLPVPDELVYHFSTHATPGVLVYGAVFGGGRMADVTGKTEVVVINCDSISAVYGGNDIAGEVKGAAGSTITLGVNANDTYATSYNNGSASQKVRILDVYGGGNGYYAYNGSSFTPASSDYTSQSVDVGESVNAMTQTGQVGNVVWTNNGTTAVNLKFPKIVRTTITMTNDVVKVDSLFGGAKNAFLTTNGGTGIYGSDIQIDGGIAYAVFGGNNIGGGQGYGKHHIDVTNTKTETTNYYTKQIGRDFGIAYLFGGGNKVYGSTTEITVTGGQMDTIFAGGNAASVYAAGLTMEVPLNKTITNAIAESSVSTIDSIDANYPWNGTGIYNVRTLFGGNNKATMECLPALTLTSGSVGTVYGGGNAGDMMKQQSGGSITFDDPTLSTLSYSFDYSTKVVVDGANMLVDFLYGGCQMSNVGYSTWVQVTNGHVGTLYGGCNISGDVGSTRVNLDAPDFIGGEPNPDYQEVYGGTYVEAKGGTIHGNAFAGSNGFYHCLDAFGITYSDATGIVYDPAGHTYYGMNVPTHNETHLVIDGNVIIEGDAYAGGNLAPVGFTTVYVAHTPHAFPSLVGLASLRMSSGEVKGNVYGGGRMASINGSNEVRVMGGRIGTGPNGGALYGGNDRLGKAGQITNRILPDIYNVASDGNTPLTTSDETTKVKTYVSVTGNPQINTVYGGGNGAYTYTGPGADMQYCDVTDLPIQSNIFVDIAIDGSKGEHGAGYIANVYGGGNGVESDGFVKVFLNVKNFETTDTVHVGTIFGGNNVGDMNRIPDIILLNGNVRTVYGGCNQGAMTGKYNITIDGTTYEDLGSCVQLRKEYTVTNTTVSPAVTTTTTTNAKVTGAVYGGCRMNGVQYKDQQGHTAPTNTLVIVEGGDHPASMFGGSDISGTISGTSQVVVKDGITGNIYGGGNGNYDYTSGAYASLTAPTSTTSKVDILGGQVGKDGDNNACDIFGGGLGASTSTLGNVTVTIGTDTASAVTYCPTVYGDIYGGSALGTVNTNSSDTTTVDILNGTIIGNIYGGGLGRKGSTEPAVDPVEAKNFGKVYVNIGKSETYNCFLDLREANVFGCNNANGSPQDSVTVNVYKTAHSYTTYPDGVSADNYSASYTGNNPQYSIRQVFGGGNEADYAPEAGSTSSTKLTTVNVFTCDNTIGRTFGGGNAAAVHKVASYIYGGRFHQVFGGGNGTADIPANIGSGGASLNVYNGNILQLFGGNNLNGEITGPMAVNVTNDGTCSENIVEFFGGSNKAVMGSITPVNLVTTIDCGAEPVRISTVYGGSNLAAIEGDVTLNIKGGEYTNVFGGSKGEVGTAANIAGAVTLNLLGGSIQQAFGGSNINGNITGKITVNVLDTVASCGLRLDTVYGSGNLTVYTPTDPTIVSPELNVLKGTVNKVVFGGGKGSTAVVTANPKVTIGDNTHTTYITKVYGEVFGGGNAAPVSGNTTVICQANHATDTIYNLFGGGNEAGVSGNATVTMTNGKITQGIYGGCNANDTVKGNIIVNITGGTLGIKGSPMTQGIFGGGFGQSTRTTGNVTVMINKLSTDTIFADVYGGSALGHVAANTDAEVKLAKVDFQSGTINGTLFGGGMGNSTYAAEVTGNAQLAIAGNVTNGVYGGCNVNGVVRGDAVVGITNGNIGLDSNLNRGIVYGGGLGSDTKVKGSVAVTINDANAVLWGDVYGGSAKGLVNYDETNTAATPDATTTVTLTNGTIHGNLYGGGHGLDNASANVYGPVTVNINGGTVGNVFGCNNLNGAPLDSVILYVTGGTMDSIFGGGNMAAYTSPLKPGTTNRTNYPALNISGGEVKYKVVGGGNAAGITGNPTVTISNGSFCTTNQYAKSGIFGGCNRSGTVNGDIVMTLTGDATHPTTIGTSAGINTDKTPVNIHGGGYGVQTNTTGSITVNYGDKTNVASDYPKLYGDIYGGSALGHVNGGGSDSTNVNLLNGSFGLFFEVIAEQEHQYGGNIYGGALGDADNAATVRGKVHVNVGAPTNTAGTYIGKADLYNCNVYGCNNVKGTPLDDVYVSVYQSKRTAGLNTVDDEDFAIKNVFGGGNVAHYVPSGAVNTNSQGHKTHVTVYGCDNTIKYVYGGGNAADVVGAITLVDGGHFDEMFGGGNGLVTPANIGAGGVCFHAFGGHVNYQYEGSNRQGENIGYPKKVYELYTNYDEVPGFVDCGDLYVDSYFFGDNEAEHIGDLNSEISCEKASEYHFVNVYAGSRYAVLYGNITLRVQGGEIQNLFGGSKGYPQRAADVRKYPTQDEINANPDKYSDAIKAYMLTHSELAGKGGNITLIIEGGVVGTVYGGCDVNGNVEGEIKVVVEDKSTSTDCPMFVGDVYGASRLIDYAPTTPNITYPEVKILKGTIGGSTTFTMGTTMTIDKDFEGNVFGGGFQGDVTANPKVIIGNVGNSNKVLIKGNVFGGGDRGDVIGSPQVIIVPTE